MVEPIGAGVLASEAVVEGSRKEQPPISIQSNLVVTPSSQSSRVGRKDVRSLVDLALLDLTASFDPSSRGKSTLRI